MLTYIPVGVEIPRKPLVNGAVCNDDGHGWAIANNEKIVVGKNMNYNKALDEFVATRETMPGSAALFHSRWATHGSIGEYNTHPFYISDTSVMAHNGVMPSEFQPERGDKRSDTRVFADLVREQFTNNPNRIPSRRAGRRIGEMIGSGNKLVFLGTTPNGPKVRIVNEQAGYSVGGVWYSNSDFKGTSWKMPGYSPAIGYRPIAPATTSTFDWEAWDLARKERDAQFAAPPRCPSPICGSYYVSARDKICKVCHVCLDCGESVATSCVCWVPPVKDVPWFMEGEEVMNRELVL